MGKWIWKYILLLVMIIEGAISMNSQVMQVSDEISLRDAISKGGNIEMTKDISISTTLVISSGNVVLDLKGFSIVYDRSNIKTNNDGSDGGNDIAISINGESAFLCVKNGKIEVKAANGGDKEWKLQEKFVSCPCRTWTTWAPCFRHMP